MSKRKKRKSERKKKHREQQEKKRQEEEAWQPLPANFNNIVNAIVDKLLNPADDLPACRDLPTAPAGQAGARGAGRSEDCIIEYEINNLKALAQMLCQKLPVRPFIRNIRGISVSVRRIPEGDVLLWHGTSLKRAQSILESGFKAKRGKSEVFFSSDITITSLRAAEIRASVENSEPAIFAAHCDLSTLEYGKDFRVENHIIETHYIFRATIANRIVKYLLTCHGLYPIGKIVTEANRFKDDLTDITITQSSGNTGIAYWLNSFLDLDDSECISENHPAVGQIKAWVDEQYENGRVIPITDEEILILAKEYELI